MTPRVSVVIPCFNGERFIAGAIECVLGQTFDELEVIVVDDGSDDGSREQIGRFADDPRVRVATHAENRGIAAARNTGIRTASASMIGFLDQDDVWKPEKIAKQVAVLDDDTRSDIGFAYTDITVETIEGRKPIRESHIPPDANELSKPEMLAALFRLNFIPMASVLVRKECFSAVGLLNEAIRSGVDDYDFFVRVVPRYRVYCIHEKLLVRREHADNYTDELKMAPDVIAINRRLVKEHPELTHLRAPRESQLLFRIGRALQMHGDRAGAERVFRDAIRVRRTYLMPYLALALGPLGGGERFIAAWNRLKKRFGWHPSF
jgi:glycosyltransferase involved in cell wall biosynthesis